MDLQARFGVAAGARDFHGSPVRPGGRTIGASDIPLAAALSAPVATTPAGRRCARRTRRLGVVLRPRCPRACTVRATLALEPRLRRRYGMRAVVARATLRLPRAGRGRLALRVSPGVVRALRRRGRRRVRVVLGTEVCSRSGRVVRTSRRVTLRLT